MKFRSAGIFISWSILTSTSWACSRSSAQDGLAVIRQLDSKDPERRAEAYERLKTMGRSALPALSRAQGSKDPEIRSRANRLIQVLGIRESLPQVLLETIPGIDEQLVGDGPHAWTEAFLEATRYERNTSTRKYPSLEGACLTHLANHALDGVQNDQELISVLESIGYRDIPGLGPRIAQLLEREGWGIADQVYWTLLRLRPPEAIPSLLELLTHTSPRIRRNSLRILADIDPGASTPHIRRLLSDEEPEVRHRAVLCLQKMGAKESTDEMVALLEDPVADIRAGAARAIGVFNARKVAAQLIPMLEDDCCRVRVAAAWSLGALGVSSAVPGIANLFEDPDPWVRTAAYHALELMGSEEAIPILLDQFKSPDSEAKAKAAKALGFIPSRKAIPHLISLLEDSDPRVRDGATESLGRLDAQSAIPRLRELLEDWNSRYYAIQALGRLGDTEAGPQIAELQTFYNLSRVAVVSLCELNYDPPFEHLLEMAEKRGESFEPLNAVRNPDAWMRLKKGRLKSNLSGSRAALWKEVLAQAGMTALPWPDTICHRDYWIQSYLFVPSRGGSTTLWDALYSIVPRGYHVILDSDGARIVDPREERRFWPAWWAEERKKNK